VGREVIKNIKCRLCRADLHRLKLICKYYGVSIVEVCGTLIKEFVEANREIGDRMLFAAKKNEDAQKDIHIEAILENIIQMLEAK
jgi:phosphoribosylaminoimidazole-succinocarboxamide synthase